MQNTISYNDIINNNLILSPSNYKNIKIASKTLLLKELIDSIDLGTEVGSINYVDSSLYKFIRTSALNDKSMTLYEDENAVLSINPNVYKKVDLKKGDILICKDSNVGEVIQLLRDYPNYMFSSGINRINIKKNKNYVFAIMKNSKFKDQLISMIPKGATLMHAKKMYLDCKIPFPDNKKIVQYVEELTEIILNKEKEILNKFNQLNSIIEDEINNNQLSKNYTYECPKINTLMEINRLDTGNYAKQFCEIDFKIKNYTKGYYHLEKKNIKGGNTPKKRIISNTSNFKYLWLTPSYINENGTIDISYRIECDNNNINENCALIINRTSKGGKGEFCGITAFYDYEKFGLAHHNQGIYKVFNLKDKELILIACLMNTKIYRQYCASLSMGSKMKELKLNSILSIPFPKFNDNLVDVICNLYYKRNNKEIKVDSKNFKEVNKKWDFDAGILDIYISLVAARKCLNEMIESIYMNADLKPLYKIF